MKRLSDILETAEERMNGMEDRGEKIFNAFQREQEGENENGGMRQYRGKKRELQHTCN